MLSNHEQQTEALLAGLIEVERYVGVAGWDQPARLFALVPTTALLEAEPALADQLTVTGPDALSSIEQDGFHPGTDLMTALSQICWPPTVAGCALSTERSFLPAGAEQDIPANPELAAEFVAQHPQRQYLRVVAGAVRATDGAILTHCVARVATNPDDLLVGADMVPALTHAVAWTLQDNEGNS